MGKISVAGNSKKDKKEREDVVGLVTPQKDRKTHMNRDVETQHRPNHPPSPTPKRPLNKAKGGCCCRVCLFTLGVLVVMIVFAAFACFLDYHQGHGHLADQTSRVTKEFKDKSKHIVEVFYQTPDNFGRFLNGFWRKGNDSDIREENKSKADMERNDGSSPVDVLEENHSGGFQDFGQFFAGLLYDVGSIFAAELNDTKRVEISVDPDNDDSRTADEKILQQNDEVILSDGVDKITSGRDVLVFPTEKEKEIEDDKDNDEIYIDEYSVNPGVSTKEEFFEATRNKHDH